MTEPVVGHVYETRHKLVSLGGAKRLVHVIDVTSYAVQFIWLSGPTMGYCDWRYTNDWFMHFDIAWVS